MLGLCSFIKTDRLVRFPVQWSDLSWVLIYPAELIGSEMHKTYSFKARSSSSNCHAAAPRSISQPAICAKVNNLDGFVTRSHNEPHFFPRWLIWSCKYPTSPRPRDLHALWRRVQSPHERAHEKMYNSKSRISYQRQHVKSDVTDSCARRQLVWVCIAT